MTARARCPHDGAYCHHECLGDSKPPAVSVCLRKVHGMGLTTPHDGFPVDLDPNSNRPVSAAPPREVWGYGDSSYTEMWHGWCDSREQAIAEGREVYGFDDFWICRGRRVDAKSFLPSIDTIFEHMAEAAYEEVGELAEEFPDVGPNKAHALERLLAEWAEGIDLNFWVSDPSTAEHIPADGACPNCEETDHDGLFSCEHCGEWGCSDCANGGMHFSCEAHVNGSIHLTSRPDKVAKPGATHGEET